MEATMEQNLAVSLLPVHLPAFDTFLVPHLRGQDVDPEPFISAAVDQVSRSYRSRRVARALEKALQDSEPPPPPPLKMKNAWEVVRAYYDEFTRRPDPFRELLLSSLDPEIHLHGRPFFIGEASPGRVAEVVDAYRSARGTAEIDRLALEQLGRISPEIKKRLQIEDDDSTPPPAPYSRSDFSFELKQLRAIVVSAERDETVYDEAGRPVRATHLLATQLPWKAVCLLSWGLPRWRMREGASLAELCLDARILSPEELETPRRLLLELLVDHPQIAESMAFEIKGPGRLGAYVPAEAVPSLQAFLKREGARLVQGATRAGNSRRCQLFLTKLREAAEFAARNGYGLLEASEAAGTEDAFAPELTGAAAAATFAARASTR